MDFAESEKSGSDGMDELSSLKAYMEAVFPDAGEAHNIAFKTKPESSFVLTTPEEGVEFVVANEIKGLSKSMAGIENVRSYKNIVLEFDKAEWTERDQINHVKKCGLKYVTATSSGNRSVHFIVRVAKGFQSLSQYEFFAKAIYYATGGAADPKCLHANRLTRLAGVIRKSTGKEQSLLEVNSTNVYQTPGELLEYLTISGPRTVRHRFEVFLERVERQKMRSVLSAQRNEQRGGPTPLPKIYEDMIANGTLHPEATSRHDSLVKLAAWSVHNGYNEEEVELLITEAADSLGIGLRKDVQNVIKYFTGKRSQ